MHASLRFSGFALIVWFIALLTTSLAASARAEEAGLHVGAAQREITPPLGFPMAGYYHERLATGTQDPLLAKALAFRDGSQQGAVVICDLIGIASDLAHAVRERASAATGIPAENIVLAATHSHTAPDYTRDLYEYLSDPDAPANRERYAARLIDSVSSAIIEAHGKLQPATLGVGTAAQETPIAFNRRFVMRDGSVRTWMNFENPEVVRSAGPIDPEVAVLQFSAVEGHKPLASFSNFALHLDTVGGTQWSADYPFYVQRALSEKFGPEFLSVFGTGCCGDINHSDPRRTERNKTDFIGQALAKTVVQALDTASSAERPQLQVRSTTIRVPLRPVSDAELERARQLLRLATDGSKVEFLDLVAAYRNVIIEHLSNPSPRLDPTQLVGWGLTHTKAGSGETLPVDVVTIAFGHDAAIVFLPGEVFVNLGLAIKQASPFKTTLVVELANCVETVYIPTRAAYAQGSYEVTNSTLDAGAGEMLVETSLQLLREAASAMNP